jgi:hypothetical protein
MLKRTHLLFLSSVLLVLLYSCSSGSDSSSGGLDKKTKNRITKVAEAFISGQLKNPEIKDLGNGVMEFSDENRRFILDPSTIRTGPIDDDNEADAIVTLYNFQGQIQTISEQLILLGSGKKYKLAASIESDMRIISIENRIITADVPEHTRDTPLFNCPSCWEVVKFQFRQGELVRTE